MIVTDTGVPTEYARTVASRCESYRIHTFPMGEESKNMRSFEGILAAMLDFGMQRGDCVVAVGGGVCGDMSGFAAGVYMRGIDFYNIPTTVLSQVDSSIGGKTAVNLGNTKNIVGSFYQPKGVLIDTDVLKTLPKRQISAGLAEAVKMSLTSDAELFGIFEKEIIDQSNIETIIARSLMIKKSVVEKDEKEAGLRKILNFGHTLGHGIEADSGLGSLYHGECVAIGMLSVCSETVRVRLLPVLEKLGLPTSYNGDIDNALSYVSHDKKAGEGGIDVVLVNKVGSFEIKKMTIEEFGSLVKSGLK